MIPFPGARASSSENLTERSFPRRTTTLSAFTVQDGESPSKARVVAVKSPSQESGFSLSAWMFRSKATMISLRFFANLAFVAVGAGVVRVDSCTDSLGLLTWKWVGGFSELDSHHSLSYRSRRCDKDKSKLEDTSAHWVKGAAVYNTLKVGGNPHHLGVSH